MENARQSERKIGKPSTSAANSGAQRRQIAIAATFTAEPIADSIHFWMDELSLRADVRFALYGQVFQELLDPSSLLSRNPDGLNVLLVRLEDWSRSGEGSHLTGERLQALERNANDFVKAVGTSARQVGSPYLVCVCPGSRAAESHTGDAQELRRVEEEIANRLKGEASVYVATSRELLAAYPVDDYEDLHAEQLGHVPYTAEFFAALGTYVARRFRSLTTPPFKVMALDCDNTLWRGVCGEEGATGVTVDAAALRLQQFALAQREAGMALCLCSKNNEADVWNVFEQNPGMILQRKHLLGWRLNWRPKSENLRALSEELRLGLDSFVLLDDSPVECAEVESRSPAVAALPTPQSDEEMARAIPNWWVFDRPRVTEEDRQRNESYAQETQREKLREQSGDLEEFLSGLQVEVEIFAPGAEDIPRVAQLTQRTNQFNFTTVRQTESETRKTWREGAAEYLAVRVRDRFGDYGIVGALVFTAGPDELELQNVLLSCRALGRRVEHAMLTRIDELAQERGLKNVSMQFSNSPKNKPAREFLESLGLGCAGADGARLRFLFAGGWLSAACAAARKAKTPAPDDTNASSSGSVAALAASGVGQARNSVFRKIAADLSSPLRVMEAMQEAMEAHSPVRHRGAAGYLAPQTELEELLAELWAHSLRVDKVGGNDNYFHLGGQSLSAMQVVSRIHDTFGVALPLETFLMSANLAEQARWIEERILLQTDGTDVESFIAELASNSPNSTGGMA